nr:MAG TPA_asm: tail protein [Bacteriophage sp.]
MIQIKRNNKVFFTLEDFGEGSKLSYQLMDHHYIILKFTTATPIYFEIGDSVEIPDFGYFELTSSYFPKHNDSDGYDYEMQMDAYYMSWKNKICKYRPQHGANETSFNLTTTVGVHMNVILGNLKALGLTYNGKDFSVDYTTYNNKAFDVQKRFLIEYGSISILDALNAICSEDALNCEWWIDGSIIYLGYCEMEGQTTFEQDVNVLSMSYSESKSTYITRLYAFGSDRNIPKGYFTGADADVTTDGVATDYLMLPNKEVDSDGFYAKDGYLENVNVVKNDKQAIEGVVMFEEEYPKVESVVSSIKTYDSTVDNEDGTKTTQTFWQVTSTDSFTNSFKESWIKSNLTLGIKFTSGALMGMEFDVSFKVIDKVNYFEIVANDTYGRTLPDGVMCPKVGDKYFLFNWDATKITDTDLIPTAQLSLFDRAKQYYQKTMISNSNFTCTMDGDKFYNDGTYDYHPLGEQVKLINDMFAQVDADGKHYRNSRIIGMEIPLDIPYDHPQYTVGEKAATSRLGKLEDKVDSIKVNGMQIGGMGSGNGGGVYVIGMNDTTPASDSNVYSARRSRMEFVSRLQDDTAKGTITWEKVQKFLQGLTAEDLSQFKKGATFGEFIQGMLFGTGGRIDELGNAEFESITSRSSIIAKELIVNRQTAMESNFVFTESGMVESVTEIPAATEGGNVTYDLKLQKRWDNDFTAFKENDVVLASINTLAENGKYYDMWLRVLSVNTVTNTITVVCYPDDECPSKKNYPPCELARLIRWGNAVDEDRQSCWYISSSEGLLVWLDHVTKPIIDKTNYSLAMGKLPDALSFLFQDFPTANKRDGAFYAKWMMAASFQQIDYQGNPIYTTRDRGVWSLAVAQGDNPYRNGDRTIDTVYYLGCKWKCLEDKTTKPPIYSSTAWAFVEGNPYFTLEILSSKLWSFRLNDLMATNADGSWKVFTTLSVVGRLYNQDVTDSMVNVVWTRDSGNPTADNKWALSHANCGLSIDLTYKDLGGAAFKIGSVTFRCDAEIKDGETMYSEDVSVSF